MADSRTVVQTSNWNGTRFLQSTQEGLSQDSKPTILSFFPTTTRWWWGKETTFGGTNGHREACVIYEAMPWSPVWPASDCKGYPLSFLLCIGNLITVQRHLFIMQVLLSMISFHRSLSLNVVASFSWTHVSIATETWRYSLLTAGFRWCKGSLLW